MRLGLPSAIISACLLILLSCGAVLAQLSDSMMMGAPPPAAPPLSGTACDIGRSPGISAPATSAGFTRCIVGADFTTGAGFWNSPANYVHGCGASASVQNTPSQWVFYNNIGYGQGDLPCGRSAIVTDPSFGNKALNILFLPGDIATNPGNEATFKFPTTLNKVAGNSTGWFPNEYFYKIRVRSDSATLLQGNSAGHYGHVDWWSTSASEGVASSGNWVDHNFMESENPPLATNWCMTQQINSPFLSTSCVSPASIDITQYHTIAAVATSDESTASWICVWLDPAADYSTGLVGCLNVPSIGSYPGVLTARDRFMILAYSSTQYNGFALLPNNSNFWITNFEVWTCPTLFSGCPGTMITHWP